MTRRVGKLVCVYLADDEWGNEKMQEIARELWAKKWPEGKRPDLISVHEHAGWWLEFDSSMRIVSTANDGWTPSQAVIDWWRQFERFEVIDEIRRDSRKEVLRVIGEYYGAMEEVLCGENDA